MKYTLGLALLFVLNVVNAQIKVPEKIIGNWINARSNDWEYGFFEEFAIYRSDFWEYEQVEVNKNHVLVKLKKGSRTESLKITTQKDKASLVITSSKGKMRYNLDYAGGTSYPMPDHRAFKNSGLKSDTVTIIGYYRNLDKYLGTAGGHRYKGPFRVSVGDPIQDEETSYHADFDSLGRFILKFSVLNTRQVFVDWGRIMQMDVMEPGEKIFLFADLADYIDMEDWVSFWSRPKTILYMGDESRFHNELAAYPPSTLFFDRQKTVAEGATDLEYLKAARTNYEARLRHLENYIKGNPAISDRFRVYQYAHEKDNLLFYLMQHRFDKLKDTLFENGYMEYVDSIMGAPNETHFTLIRDYAWVVKDYLGYYKALATSYKDEKTGKLMFKDEVFVTDADVLIDMMERKVFNEHDKALITSYSAFLTVRHTQIPGLNGDTAKINALLKPYKKISMEGSALVERLGIRDSMAQLQMTLLDKKLRAGELKHIDTLIHSDTLKQLLMAKVLYQAMDHSRIQLSNTDLKLLKEKVTIQPIYDYIMTVNNYYVNLSNKQQSYRSSLKNTDHLKEARDADALLHELISPYKGKVIYMDFWGTWCGPCRDQMKHVGEVKKELEGQDVIFMYLANNSPEESWTNVIKQMNLTGENVVHYRLPAEQQAMIERRLSVRSFPTYLFFDKNGNLVRDDAPRPEQKTELIAEISKLLQN